MTNSRDVGDLAFPWRIVLILTFLNILSYMDRQLIALLALPIQASLGLDDFELGLVQGLAYSLLFTVATIPVGWAVDQMSRRRIIFTGVIFWSVATAACGIARNFVQLLFCRFAVGIGEASLSPSAYAILADHTPRGRLALSTGIYAAGASIGIAAALAGGGIILGLVTVYPLSLPVLGTPEPWQSTFLILGTAGIFCAALTMALPAGGQPIRPADGIEPATWSAFFRFLLTRRAAFAAHLVGFSMIGLAAYAVASWTPAYLGRTFGWTPEMIGPKLALAVGLAGLAGTLAWSWIADHLFGKGRFTAYFDVHIATAAVGTPIIASAFLVDDPNLCLILIGTGYFILCGVGGSCTAALQLMTPARFRGRSAALYILSLNIVAVGLGPLLVGAMTTFLFADPARLGTAIIVIAATAGTISLAFLSAGRRSHGAAIASATEG